MTYFKECNNIEEVKCLYKKLAKENHPDLGGDTEIMQQINTEYAFACAKILKGENLSQEEINTELTKIEAYKNAINAVINIEGLQIEVVGTWIWITGNTYPHRSKAKGGTGILPEAGYVFAGQKMAWYFRTEEFKTHNRKKMSLDEIRFKYGSQQVKNSYERSLK